VRDRLGIKPLYWAVSGDQLLFASELKCLLACGLISTELDYEAIDAYLVLGLFPGPTTPLRAVRKLQPGHRIVVEPSGWRVEGWWQYPEPSISSPNRSVEEWSDILLEKLRESVRLRLMSDVPLGAMLSGGLDSSLIVALMSEMVDEPVKTFSVGFAGGDIPNELADARAVAELYETDHHELQLGTDDAIDLSELVWHLDEPLADLSALGFIALCGLARRDVTVALSGQGADELLGGYRRYASVARVDRLSYIPGVARRAIGLSAPIVPSRFRRAARTIGASGAADRYLALTGNIDARRRAALVRGPLAAQDGLAAWRSVSAHVPRTDDALAAALVLDARIGLVDDMLHYFDRASMAHSLEVRVPFLDHELVELCSTVPPDMKVRDGTTKYLLKHAARGLVPDHLIDKPKVGFFNAAVGGWFSSAAGRSAADVLLDPAARSGDIVDREAVADLLARQRQGDRGASAAHALLTVLMLELWLATFLPRATTLKRTESDTQRRGSGGSPLDLRT
jgi:asparagine synthase (glutamine-hydrolysing)